MYPLGDKKLKQNNKGSFFHYTPYPDKIPLPRPQNLDKKFEKLVKGKGFSLFQI